jgi:phenylalanyl-tRNA synthetase beta chain
VRQDRAWWFPAAVAAADVLDVVREAGGALLHRAEVFDVYPEGERRSLALRLEFRAGDRTLTDEEVALRRAKIDAAVAERLGGEPRG